MIECLALLDGLLEGIDFTGDFAAVTVRLLANLGHFCDGLILAVVLDQPTRRFDAERHPDEQQNRRDHLHGNGDHPPLAGCLVGVGTAHASTPDAADVDEDLDITGEETSQGGRRELSLIGRDSGLDDADGQVREDTADGELHPVLGRDFD